MKIRPLRPAGVAATLDTTGRAAIVAASGHEIALAASASAPGFTPLEMLDAALAGCLAVSVRIAAARAGMADRLGDVRVEVVGSKAEDAPDRVERQVCRFTFGGSLTAEEKALLIADAHALCTVGHSFAAGIEVVDA